MRPSNHESAMANPTTHHMLRPGEYVDDGPLPLPPNATDATTAKCLPPWGTADGTVHVLKPGHDATPQTMIWRAEHRAWSAHGHKGRRMAFPAAYLAAHGWRYVGAHKVEVATT